MHRATMTLARPMSIFLSLPPPLGWRCMCMREGVIAQLLSKVKGEPMSKPTPLLHALTRSPIRHLKHRFPGHRERPAQARQSCICCYRLKIYLQTGRSAMQTNHRWAEEIWANCLSLGCSWHRCKIWMWMDSIIHLCQLEKEYEWELAGNDVLAGMFERASKKSNGSITPGQLTRSTSRLTDQSTAHQAGRPSITSDAWRDTILFSQLNTVYNFWNDVFLFTYWKLFVMSSVNVEAYEVMELCDMWTVRLYSNSTGAQRDAGSSPKVNDLILLLFLPQISVFIMNCLK